MAMTRIRIDLIRAEGVVKFLPLFGMLIMVLVVSGCGQRSTETDQNATTPNATESAESAPTLAATSTPAPSWTPTQSPQSTSSPLPPSSESYEDVFPAWSPDGTRIAFVSDRDGDPDVYVMDANGSNPVQLTRDQSLVLISLYALTNRLVDLWPSWSPDGDRVAFASSRHSWHSTILDFNIYTISADGSDLRKVTEDGEWGSWPSWSPDGIRIAFMSPDNGPQLFLVDADGSNLVGLTSGSQGGGLPAWSPDGSRIAFTSERDGDQEIYTMDAQGVSAIQLTYDPATDQLPAWSPDGSMIAFVSDRGGNPDIYLMDANGANVIQLTDDPELDSAPAWSPDGSRIVFHSYRDGDADIYVMDADGSNIAQLTHDQPLEYDLQTADGYYHRALGHMLRGDLEKAVDDLAQAITLDPNHANAYLARGLVYGHPISSLDPERAIPDLQAALKLGVDPVMQPVIELLLQALEAAKQED
jgi:Tol biopolymer transport system component